MTDCIFCKINAKLIPAKIIYNDDQMLAFYDINPKAQVHFLITPKEHIESMIELKDDHINLIGQMMVNANKIAQQLGLLKGYKIQVNNGHLHGQEVFHLHIHVLGSK